MPARLFLAQPVVRHGAVETPALAPRFDMAPGETIWTRAPGGFREMRWGLIPSGRRNARGRPVLDTIVNSRGESVFDKRAFAGLRRAAVPVDGWHASIGRGDERRVWEFRRSDRALLWCAAIWDVWPAPGGHEIAQFAMVTCPASGDLRHVLDRMFVPLGPEQVTPWLEGPEEVARGLIAGADAGSLSLREVDQAVFDPAG